MDMFLRREEAVEHVSSDGQGVEGREIASGPEHVRVVVRLHHHMPGVPAARRRLVRTYDV